MKPIITVSPNVVYKRLGEEVILINLDTDRIFSLNQTGAKTWELIESTRDLDEVKKGLAETYDVTPEVLDSELVHIIDSFTAEGFITIEE
jgi:hypothetical protein